jgi:hypothetical protein
VLHDAFAQVDRNNTGFISSDKWAGVLEHVTGLQIAWHDLVDVLVSPEDRDGDNIQWAKFISKVLIRWRETTYIYKQYCTACLLQGLCHMYSRRICYVPTSRQHWCAATELRGA